MPATRLAATSLLLTLLAGCEMLGIESPEKVAALKDNEGRAVGSACRHALRAIEDCYALNPRAVKSAVMAGWREMDEYMRENKLEGVAPVLVKAAGRPEPVARAEVVVPAEPAKGSERKPAKPGRVAHDS